MGADVKRHSHDRFKSWANGTGVCRSSCRRTPFKKVASERRLTKNTRNGSDLTAFQIDPVSQDFTSRAATAAFFQDRPSSGLRFGPEFPPKAAWCISGDPERAQGPEAGSAHQQAVDCLKESWFWCFFRRLQSRCSRQRSPFCSPVLTKATKQKLLNLVLNIFYWIL